MRIEIPMRLPGLNEIIEANRKNKHKGAQQKKKVERDIAWYINQQATHKVTKPFVLKITWVEPNRKRDPDNLVSAKKFILDALQNCGVIEGDGWKDVVKFEDEWVVENRYKVIVDIIGKDAT